MSTPNTTTEKHLEHDPQPTPSPQSSSPPVAPATLQDDQPTTEKDVESTLPKAGRQELEIQDQSSHLPPRQMLLVCLSLILTIILASLEMTGVSTTLPAIATSIHTGQAVSWVGTSFLVASTVAQACYGRLSDIFGRKNMMLSAIALFFVGNLACGFARNLAQLIVFRAIAGTGGGGLLIIAVVILSDVTSLRNRGKILGYMGLGNAVGFAVGPILGGVFAEHDWRWVFWCICPLCAIAGVFIWFFLPLKPVTGSAKEKWLMIDYLGSFTQLVSVVFILVPISGGGTSYAWSSPIVIVLLILGGIFAILFLVVEKYFAKLPLIPLRLFKNRSYSFLALNSFLTGMYLYSTLYYMPVYFQLVRQSSPIHSSLLLLAVTLPQVVAVALSGMLVSKIGRYNPVLWAGYTLYTIGAGLVTRFDRQTSTAYIVGVLLLQGIGLGCTLQNTLVAMQAHSPHPDRAVTSSLRNLVRFIGGSIGIAICSAIFANISSQQIRAATSDPGLIQLAGNTLDLPKGLTAQEREIILQAYEKAIKSLWWFFLALAIVVSALGFSVKEIKLREDEKKVKEEEVKAEDDAEGGEPVSK